MWELDATPQFGLDPQAAVNEQLVDSSDILVAILWTRLGSPTPRSPSGTVEEITRFVDAKKPGAKGRTPRFQAWQRERAQMVLPPTRPRNLVAEHTPWIAALASDAHFPVGAGIYGREAEPQNLRLE
jgi:hypothetical protein